MSEASDLCDTAVGHEVLLRAEALHRNYPMPRQRLLGPRPMRHALRGVGLEIDEGGSIGIVGESGSGKSTLVRLLLALDRADSGTVTYRSRPVSPGAPRTLRWFRREVQMVLQDPFASLDPRMRVADIVAEPLECLDVPGDHAARVTELLKAVGLDAAAAKDRYPHEFSGGQRQRIAIARALAPAPPCAGRGRAALGAGRRRARAGDGPAAGPRHRPRSDAGARLARHRRGAPAVRAGRGAARGGGRGARPHRRRARLARGPLHAAIARRRAALPDREQV